MSIPSVAVELAQRTLGELEDRRVLVVGAGETAELTARALAAKGVQAIFIANRHYDRAIGLAERFGGQRGALRGAARAADRRRHRRHLDQLAAPRDRARGARRGDGRRATAGPLLLIDLAVPRDIHPACREVAGGQPLRHGRPPGAGRAQRLRPRGRGAPGRGDPARRAAPASTRWLAAQEVTPTVAALRERADEIVERVLDENDRRWEGLTEADRERLAGRRPGDRLAAAARADAAAEARRRRGRRLRQGRGRCASSSASTRPASRSSRPAPRSPISASAASAAAAA